MIRIPGTPEGVRAIEQAIYEGINVNVTSMLAVSAYEAVAAPPAVPGASAGPSEANARLDDGRRWRRI
jgi:transaldolase